MYKFLFILFLSSFLLSSCNDERRVFISTLNIRNIDSTSAEVVGDIYVSGNENPYEVGIVYSDKYPEPYFGGSPSVKANTSSGYFSIDLTDLEDSTTYYVRAYYYESGWATYHDDPYSFTTTKTTPLPAPPQIGGTGPAGGIVFYDDGNGGGMEVVVSYLQADWGCLGVDIPGTTELMGSGQANTDSILAHCSSASNLASLCANFSYGGYDDWHMPSIAELYKIYDNIYSQYPGVIDDNIYISSSESSSDPANMAITMALNGGNATTSQMWKDANTFYTLPVRTF